ncbi:PadR family transcriptional regulator [Actinoplanes nipponensis]
MSAYGWMIAKDTGRSGPTVYGILDRLEQDCWIDSEWEQQEDPANNRPRRRMYRLTKRGRTEAFDLLSERRPHCVRKLIAAIQAGRQ